MNQSLNEFMKDIQRTPGRSTVASDANLDITNLDTTNLEDESAAVDKNGGQKLNGSSTTAEFKKYLDELKKNYLEKLTFSCPSKPSRSALRSLENRELENYGALTNSNVNTRRSLYFDNKPAEGQVEQSTRQAAQLPAAFRSDTLGKRVGSELATDRADSQPKQLDRINETVSTCFFFVPFSLLSKVIALNLFECNPTTAGVVQSADPLATRADQRVP